MSNNKKSMLNDTYFRRSFLCSKYSKMLATKEVPQFPIKKLKGNELDDYIVSIGLDQPILVSNDKDTLGLILPDSSTSLLSVAKSIGYGDIYLFIYLSYLFLTLN
jgi:hypothetical protein